MDDLFRCMTVRAPRSADAGAAVTLTGPSSTTAFLDQLVNALRPPPPAAPPAPDDRWSALEKVAEAFQATPAFANPLSSLSLAPAWTAFDAQVRALLASPPADALSALGKAVQAAFGKTAAALVAGDAFKNDWTRIDDSVVSLFISQAAGSALLTPLANLARLVALIARVAANDATLNAAGGLADATQRTLLLPASIFPLDPGLVQPVGVADLLVVRQHLSRYEVADLSSVENVLKGETKKHTQQHTLTTQQEEITEVERTEVKEEELTTDERFDLKNEVQSVVQQDLQAKAGVSATYSYGDVLSVNAKVDVAYAKASSDASKLSTEFAKDVTLRAATKVTTRVLSRRSHQVIETFEEDDVHTLTGKGQNSVGLYQWLTKVYSAQVFNYGKRLLFDLDIPEPAAFLRDAASSQQLTGAPVEPPPFTLQPHQIVHDDPDHPDYYQTLLARYGVLGFAEPPPPLRLTASQGLSLRSPNPDEPRASPGFTGDLPLPKGYEAQTITVNGTYNTRQLTDEDKEQFQGVRITVGNMTFTYGQYLIFGTPFAPGWVEGGAAPTALQLSPAPRTAPASRERDQIPVAVTSERVADLSFTIEVDCHRTDDFLDAWKVRVHQAVEQAFLRRLSELREQVAARSFQGATGTLGGNPDFNRLIERTELKKAAIQLLSGRDLVARPLGAVLDTAPASVAPPPPPAAPLPYPRPDLASAQEQGRLIRFFEQAFEWENISYLFYPYYWARAETWYDLARLEHDDPKFAEFLQAGEARVVVPVRPGFEGDVRYFLLTGQIWGGGDMPSIASTDYLPIAEEIRAASGAPGSEVPQGDPWEVRVPTSLVRVRDGSALPSFTRTGDWTWTPG